MHNVWNKKLTLFIIIKKKYQKQEFSPNYHSHKRLIFYLLYKKIKLCNDTLWLCVPFLGICILVGGWIYTWAENQKPNKIIFGRIYPAQRHGWGWSDLTDRGEPPRITSAEAWTNFNYRGPLPRWCAEPSLWRMMKEPWMTNSPLNQYVTFQQTHLEKHKEGIRTIEAVTFALMMFYTGAALHRVQVGHRTTLTWKKNTIIIYKI